VVFAYIVLTSIINNKKEWLKILMLSLKRNIVVFLGFLIGWSPLLAFEFRHDFLDFINITNFVLHSGNTGANSNFFYTVYDVFLDYLEGWFSIFPQRNSSNYILQAFLDFWIVSIIVVALISLLLLLNSLYKVLN